MSKLVIAMKKDMDPNHGFFEESGRVDFEMNRLETRIPSDCTPDEAQEINEMIDANRELRERVSGM